MPPRRSSRAASGSAAIPAAKPTKPAKPVSGKQSDKGKPVKGDTEAKFSATNGENEEPKTKKRKQASDKSSPAPAEAQKTELDHDDGAECSSSSAAAAGAAKPKKGRQSKPTAGGSPESPAAPKGKDDDIVAFEGCPKTVDIPNPLSFEDAPRGAGKTRIATWNIVSLKSAEPKGLVRYLEAEDADIVFLSETKVNEVPSFFQKERYPYQTWGIGATKSYAGVALLSKIKPVSVVQKGVGEPLPGDYDTKSRCLIAEFAGCYVVGTYCVNAGEGLKSMDTKKAWNEVLSRRIHELDRSKPVIWTGDLNVVYDSSDLAKASAKWNKSAGYTQIECDHHRDFLEGKLASGDEEQAPGPKYVDVWRNLHPGARGHFTYYGWRGQCRIKGFGWRIDSFIVSQRVKDKCHGCEIRHGVYGAR